MPNPKTEKNRETVCIDSPCEWKISFAEPTKYDPQSYPNDCFTGEKTVNELHSIAKDDAHFAGFVKYEADIELSDGDYNIDLGRVGEVAYLWVNGKPVGQRLIAPYCFDFTAENGNNKITVVTTSHLGYKMRDKYSAFYDLGVIGISGEVKMKKYID